MTGTTSPVRTRRSTCGCYGPGDYRFRGADLGILVTKGRMQTADGLTQRCRRYIEGIRTQYVSEPVEDAPSLTAVPSVK